MRLPLRDAELVALTTIPLSADDTHYLVDVLRLTAGDTLLAFDGKGQESPATLLRATEGWALRIDGPLRKGVGGGALTLAYGLPKGEKIDALLAPLTELGLSRLLLLDTARSVSRLDLERAAHKRERWARVIAAAARQCGRSDTVEIEGPLSLADALTRTTKAASRLVLHPTGGRSFTKVEIEAPVTLFVGPEGGFAGPELAAMDGAGMQRVSLGPRVLRTETAAVVACALALHRMGEL